jgi:hypothetical protein
MLTLSNDKDPSEPTDPKILLIAFEESPKRFFIKLVPF